MLPRHLLVLPAALMVVGLLGAPAQADPYVGTVTTSCNVDLDASADDRRLSAVVDVTAAGAAPAPGVLVAVFSGPGGVMSTRSVDYEGGRVVLDGPKAKDKGRYLAQVSFAPRTGTVFTKCRDDDGVDVGVSGTGDGEDPDETDTGTDPQAGQADNGDGVLPDTGGQARWVPLAGAGLVLLGAVVLFTRRRRSH